MEVKIETGMLKGILKAICLNGTIETPVMTFKENYLESANVDMANVMMSVCRFDKNLFLDYVVPEEEDIAIEAEKTMKLLKQVSEDEISIERKDNSLIFVTGHEKLKVPIIEKSRVKKTPLIEINENGEISVADSYELQLEEVIPVLLKEIEAMGEFTTTFEVKDKKLSIMQETTDGYSFQSMIKEGVDSEDFTSVFTTEYLKPLFNSLIDNEVRLKFGKNSMPIIAEDKTNNYQVVILLVPRVEYQ